jgi:membrane protein DedA with SNARE-associated domain
MATESACIPLPSEIIMPFSGYLVTTGRFNLFVVATAGTVGCMLGSTIAYGLGALGGRRTVERWGRFVLMTPRDLERVDHFFTHYGAVTVFVGRLLPVVRTFISLPAGIAQMPFVTFQGYTFAGSWLWCFALAYAGQKLGEAWNTNPALKATLHTADLVIVVSLLGFIGWYIVAAVRRIRRG